MIMSTAEIEKLPGKEIDDAARLLWGRFLRAHGSKGTEAGWRNMTPCQRKAWQDMVSIVLVCMTLPKK